MGWGVYYPEPPAEPPRPRCPVCGDECEYIYRNFHNEILGCDNCITKEYADEMDD